MTDKKKKVHYVDNKRFSQAVMDYVTMANEYKERGEDPPVVPTYIAECFLKISKGISNKPNFIRYTYKEEMIMDAVENCLTAIKNYDISTTTRGGNPNAFGYFTLIAWRAFLRRLAKEKKQHEIKEKFMNQSGAEMFMDYDNSELIDENTPLIEEIRSRIERVKIKDEILRDFAKEEKRREVAGE
jgi:hypothetical protein